MERDSSPGIEASGQAAPDPCSEHAPRGRANHQPRVILIKRWAAALLVGAASVAAQAPDVTVATWRGEPRTMESLAQQQCLGAEPIRAVQTWTSWATERDYRLVLSETGRVMLVLSPTYKRRAQGKKEDNTVERFLESVEKTIAEVDRLIPPHLAAKERSRTVVVIGARQKNFADVVVAIVTQNEALREWAQEAALARAGCILSDPLVGVWIEDPPNTEEWNPESELIHRVACELILRHSPNLPAWLQLGLTWHVEERVMRSIYCFPYRTGFVSIYDHSDWHTALRQMFKKRDESPLRLEEVARWNPRAGFDMDDAYRVFGVARYLADYAPECLGPLLRELDEQITKKRKVQTGEFTWEIDTNYRLPIPEQLAVIEKHVGEDFLEQATIFFMKGKKYRPPKKK